MGVIPEPLEFAVPAVIHSGTDWDDRMAARVYFFDLRRSARELRDGSSFGLTYDRVLAGAVSRLVRKSIPAGGLANGFAAVKVHFGERGNVTFVPPTLIEPIVRALEEAKLAPFLTDTGVLYRSPRADAVGHASLAAEHGFAPPGVSAPVIIADGLVGDDVVEVAIGKKWFARVKIASAIARAGTIVVVSRAKAHSLMGFSGAIKNLGMGCAARKGKEEQHGGRYVVDASKCTLCGRCLEVCGTGAMRGNFTVDDALCNRCGQCWAVCPERAVLRSTGEERETDIFPEKVCEYALGAVKGKMVVCVTFLTNVAPYCDCNARADPPIVPDIGVLFSSDPVAIDKAAYDLVNSSRGKDHFAVLFPESRPDRQMKYGKKIGLGTTSYILTPVESLFPSR
jgi:uncharacterized Fe-S center protein